MNNLNLPDYSEKLRINKKNNTILDICRNKHIALTPEEWVRQNFVQYMINELGYPKGLIAIEMAISLNSLSRRCDIVCFNKNGKPILIVECKAPSVKISQQTFDQVATYNLKLKVDYLVVTNGLSHFCCMMDYSNNSHTYLKHIPKYCEVESI